MDTENFFIFNCGFFKYTVAYFDTIPYKADAIFVKNNLKIKFINNYIYKNNTKLVLVFAKIPKNKLNLFAKCMSELKNKMLILGDTDYLTNIKDIMLGLEGE